MNQKASLAPSLQHIVLSAKSSLAASQVIERIWQRDHRVWKSEPTEIANRLGWLNVIDDMQEQAQSLITFAKAVRDRGIRDVVLLGMGGSSLGPEVLRATFGTVPRFPRLWVLDSTVPGWVQQVTEAVNPEKTLFIVASKSGGTIEVMSLLAHFWELVAPVSGDRAGDHFVAITDPSTGLEKLAANRRFWRIFTNPPDIGGRYSVLSYFGLVPAALMGIDIRTLLARAAEMARRCHLQSPIDQNPGADLGATMAALARGGRDKITVMASPKIGSFGLWAEQLLAESTGKEGTGLIPVAEEPMVSASAYGHDRLFVYLRLAGDHNRQLDRHMASLARRGQPGLTLDLRDRHDLGAEFFRWEFATAIAGHLLGIHPFDQPNVQESKNNTNHVLNQLRETGHLPKQKATSARQAAIRLKQLCRPGSYVAILAYATPSAKIARAVNILRKTLVTIYGVSTTAGYGPRYLHSTGQLHKGGPKSGLFLQLIERMRPDVKIPEQPFTFGTLAAAQAAGDVEALHAHEREALIIALGNNPTATLAALTNALSPKRAVRRSTVTRKKGRRPRKK